MLAYAGTVAVNHGNGRRGRRDLATIYVPSGTVDAIAAKAIAKARGAEPDHDPPDSRNHMAKPYDDALIGHLRNNPPRNE